MTQFTIKTKYCNHQVYCWDLQECLVIVNETIRPEYDDRAYFFIQTSGETVYSGYFYDLDN